MSRRNYRRSSEDGASPHNIADIKLRLLHNAPNDPDSRRAVEELARMGAAAAPLIPLLLELYRNDRMPYLASETAVGLYASTRSDELLNAWRKQGGVCTALDNCHLLELGVANVEEGLLQYLWERWEKVELFNFREDVVKTLGQHGSSKSLEMLEEIQCKLEGKLAELLAALPDDWDENPAFETILHELFLKTIWEAVQLLGDRLSSSDRAVHQEPDDTPKTTVRASQTTTAEGPLGYDDDKTGSERQEDSAVQTAATPFGDYDLLRQITKAGMAEAFIARCRLTGEKVFLKRVPLLSTEDAASIQREAAIYADLMRRGLPGVLRIENAARCEDHYFLVTEYADGGDLEEHVNRSEEKRLSPREAKSIGLENRFCALQLAQRQYRSSRLEAGEHPAGEWHLEDWRFWHLEEPYSSRYATDLPACGTSGYAPPEQLDGAEAHSSMDIYSYGKILVFLLSAQTDVDCVHLPPWRNLILRCIDRERDHRPDATTVLAGLQTIVV